MKVIVMNNCMSIISGVVYSSLDIHEFSILLNEHNISSGLGDSSYYNNNTYIRIEEGVANFILENNLEEYEVIGDASSSSQMYQVAKRVSDVLTLLDISHEFEIYVESNQSEKLELVNCLSHKM
jgi:hypothetical protein